MIEAVHQHQTLIEVALGHLGIRGDRMLEIAHPLEQGRTDWSIGGVESSENRTQSCKNGKTGEKQRLCVGFHKLEYGFRFKVIFMISCEIDQ